MANARKLQQIWTEKGMYVGIKKKMISKKAQKKGSVEKWCKKEKENKHFIEEKM